MSGLHLPSLIQGNRPAGDRHSAGPVCAHLSTDSASEARSPYAKTGMNCRQKQGHRLALFIQEECLTNLGSAHERWSDCLRCGDFSARRDRNNPLNNNAKLRRWLLRRLEDFFSSGIATVRSGTQLGTCTRRAPGFRDFCSLALAKENRRQLGHPACCIATCLGTHQMPRAKHR